jgi:dTMP kinase
MSKRGAFIVIEGLDRSGKSTQTSLLYDRLKNANEAESVHLLKFPDRTTAIGRMIDSYLRSQSDLDDHAIHLLFSANRWELASTITTLLNAGTTVVADRYVFSGVAFSASKGLSYEWCRAPDIGLPAPDLTVFLDVEPETARQRGGFGEERYEKEEMQRRVREVFERIGKESGRWVVVDAGKQKEDVHEDIWGHVEPLKGGVDSPMKRLWEEHLLTRSASG